MAWWRGVQLDQRTADMIQEVANRSGSIFINPTQGSYSSSVGASAGTHSGCGALDLMHPTWSVSDYDTVVALMRSVGFAAWHRTPQQSSWPRHVHGIAVQRGGKWDGGCLPGSAHGQVQDYYNGLNGLASRGRDDGPRQYVGTTWESYQEEEMPLTDADLKKIADAVWARQTSTGWQADGTYDKGKQRKVSMRTALIHAEAAANRWLRGGGFKP